MAIEALPGPDPADDGDTGLDPHDWVAFRSLAHRMLDDSLDHIAGRRDEPWASHAGCRARRVRRPPPPRHRGLEAAYDDFRRTVVPYSMGNDHPRFWGWYMGPGNPVGNLADLLASVLNPNLGGADHAPVLVEQQVVRWCAEAAGYRLRERAARQRRVRGQPGRPGRGPHRPDRARGAHRRPPR